MPKRKRGYSKKRKRTKRYRRGFRRRKYTRYRGVPAIRKKARVRFRYAEHDHKLTSTTGQLDCETFLANGCFDPNVDLGGHQPYGWDQWAPYFTHYVVVGSKMTCYFTSDGTVNGTCGVYLDDNDDAPDNVGHMIESRRGSFSIITNQRVSAKARSTYSPKKFYNIRNIKDNIDRLGAQTTTDPADKAFFCVWFEAEQGATATVNFVVVIDYIVEFSQPITVAQS